MRVYKADSVRDLLERCHQLTFGTTSGTWLFRGQADSSWGLLPSSLRGTDVIEAKQFEATLLSNLRRVVKDRTDWPARLLEEDAVLLALAQHYGVRTRLLDWTLDPMIALYFAAAGALRDRSIESLSVFAMAELYVRVDDGERGRIIKPPRAVNPNLVAQKGALVLHSWDLTDLWDEAQAEETPDPVAGVSALVATRLVRLDLSSELADDALAFCLARGVDASVLFPTEHGIARLAEDLTLLDPLKAARHHDPRLFVLRPGSKPPS